MEETRVDDLLEELTSIPKQVVSPNRFKRVFRNRFGHWRAGWRILLYIVAAVAIGKSLGFLVRLVLPNSSDAPFLSWTYSSVWVVANLALLLAALFLLKWFDRRPISILGLGFGRGWARELLIGVAAGILLTGSVVILLVISGSVRLEISAHPAQSLAAIPFYLVLFTLAGTVEELLFRGYPLQVLAEGSRRWIAALLLCLPFTVGHVGNPDITRIGLLNIFLVGILLALIYFKTLRLWMPIGLHLSWNFCQSWLWGFDVSGIKIENTFFLIETNGADYLTGGGFGLEGSAVAVFVILLFMGWIYFTRGLRPTIEMAALHSPYPTGFDLTPIGDFDAPAPANGLLSDP